MKLENRLSLFLGHCYQILFKTKLMEYENLKLFFKDPIENQLAEWNFTFFMYYFSGVLS